MQEPQDVLDTILHEVAHAIVGAGHGHDRVWARKMRELGLSPDRQVRVAPPTPFTWVASCECGRTFGFYRKPTRTYICKRCRVTLDYQRV